MLGRHGTKREGRKNGGDLTKSQICFILPRDTPSEQGKIPLGAAESKNKLQKVQEPNHGYTFHRTIHSGTCLQKGNLSRGTPGKLVVADGYRKGIDMETTQGQALAPLKLRSIQIYGGNHMILSFMTPDDSSSQYLFFV